MIQQFNLLLRKIFQNKLDMSVEQIGFEPPDENWRKYVDGLQGSALNIYLTELRENRGMRTNEGLRHVRDEKEGEQPAPCWLDKVRNLPAPRWLDCHYLITAWNSAAPDIARGVEPTLAEHAILSAAAGCLLELETEPLTLRVALSPDSLPDGYQPELIDVSLPVTILPGEGFPKLAEFWGSMGSGYRWKPAVYMVATLPLIKSTVAVSSPVTSYIIEAHLQEKPVEKTEKKLEHTTGSLPDKGGNK